MDFVVIFEKFGLPTAFLIFMIWLFLRADDKTMQERQSHREERREWRENSDKLHTETNRALHELTKAISKSDKSN